MVVTDPGPGPEPESKQIVRVALPTPALLRWLKEYGTASALPENAGHCESLVGAVMNVTAFAGQMRIRPEYSEAVSRR